MVDVETSVLNREEISDRKAEEFSNRLEKIYNQNWSRDNFEDLLSSVDDLIEQVEEHLLDIQEDIGEKRDKLAEREESFEQVFDGGVEELESRNIGDSTFAPTIKSKADILQGVVAGQRRWRVWKSYQFELLKAVKVNMHSVLGTALDEMESVEVLEDMKDVLDSFAEDKEEALFDKFRAEIVSELDKRISLLEHQTEILSRDEGEKISCDDCGRVFTSFDEAKDHTLEEHTEEQPQNEGETEEDEAIDVESL